MKCDSVKTGMDTADDGRKVVTLYVGNKIGRSGKHFAVGQVAWIEMSPGMARSVAADLIEVADAIEK